jgi:hypothetical protein
MIGSIYVPFTNLAVLCDKNGSMKPEPRDPSELPGRLQSLVFHGKTGILRLRRGILEWGEQPARHLPGEEEVTAPVIGEARAKLWTQVSDAEFPLTAGKVENLRISAQALHGLVIPASEVFSFWRQLGRTTRRKGYTVGRELREGCMVPNRGGGLCQVTGLLYQAALEAGLEIVERHEHSRLVPGSMGEKNLDATVFWNYVDLRFRAPFQWRLEVELDASDLIVRIKADRPEKARKIEVLPDPIVREAPSGDCLTCNQTECFRHPSAVSAHAPTQGLSAFLLDAWWPEFDEWCGGHSREGDHWLTPMDGQRYMKSNYSWTIPKKAKRHHATLSTFLRSFRQRRLPAQGAVRQKALLESDRKLAEDYQKRLSPECRHLIISQNLLPHLWKMGVLGGRTFDVLMERWPLEELQRRLNEAARQHPESPTLGDFRADPVLVRMESEALARAGKLITPHRAIAKHFGHRAWLLDWKMPEVEARSAGGEDHFFLPCSPLGRKGIYDLEGLGKKLVVLGRAREGGGEESFQQGELKDLKTAMAVVLPAWVEHQPRLALRSLAMGIPVFATEECGLPDHPLLRVLPREEFGSLDEAQKKAGAFPYPDCGGPVLSGAFSRRLSRSRRF